MDPRPAATVVVARPAEGGVEVLMLRRAEGSRFAPGFVVFPGGTTEPGDRALADRLFGDPSEELRACALRELFEETGLLPTAAGLELRRHRSPVADLDFDPPPPGRLREMARWVAPDFLEVRFDAVFFALEAPPGLEPVPDQVEVDRAWWAAPREVLLASRSGEAPLMWPTLVTLERLAEARSVADVLALRIEQIEPGREDREAGVRGEWRRPEWRPS